MLRWEKAWRKSPELPPHSNLFWIGYATAQIYMHMQERKLFLSKLQLCSVQGCWPIQQKRSSPTLNSLKLQNCMCRRMYRWCQRLLLSSCWRWPFYAGIAWKSPSLLAGAQKTPTGLSPDINSQHWLFFPWVGGSAPHINIKLIVKRSADHRQSRLQLIQLLPPALLLFVFRCCCFLCLCFLCCCCRCCCCFLCLCFLCCCCFLCLCFLFSLCFLCLYCCLLLSLLPLLP